MSFWDFVFPKKCTSCNRMGDYLCASCFAFLAFDDKSICIVCRSYTSDGRTHQMCQTTSSLDGVIAALKSNSTSRKLLYRFKNDPYISSLKEYIGELFYESIIQSELFHAYLKTDVWTLYPVGITKDKLRVRGYNQSNLLADELSKRLNLKKEKSKNIFLIDDVIRSGGTLRSASEDLKKEGVEKVVGLVLIRDK